MQVDIQCAGSHVDLFIEVTYILTKTQFVGRNWPTPVSFPFVNNKKEWYKSIVGGWPKIMESVARFSQGNLDAMIVNLKKYW